MAKPANIITALDLGTSVCCAVIAEIGGPEKLDIIGVGTRKSRGVRKGVIVNLESLVSSLQGAVEDAEAMAGHPVQEAMATVPGAQVRSFTSHAVVTISAKDRIVTTRDLDRVLETVRAVQIPTGQSILHVLPQEYTLDGQQGIQDPVGMTGSRLEASVHVVTVPQQSGQHVVTAINRSQIEVGSLVFPLLAAAETALTPDEKDLGVFLIDCGGGTTDIALFDRGALWSASSIPVAGELITNDISIGLRTPVPDAEQIKRNHARALLDEEDDLVLEIPTVGGGPPRLVGSQLLTQIVQPRVREIFELVKQRIDRVGLAGRARAGAVLVGGSANLDGMLDVAEEVLEMPVRKGVPQGIGGLIEEVKAPSFSTAVGLTLWELRHGRKERAKAAAAKKPVRVISGIGRGVRQASAWIGNMF